MLVYGDSVQPIDQETGTSPMSGYGRAKLEDELRLEKLAAKAVGLDLKYPNVHDGIPAVLDDSISFYWLPSNLDRL